MTHLIVAMLVAQKMVDFGPESVMCAQCASSHHILQTYLTPSPTLAGIIVVRLVGITQKTGFNAMLYIRVAPLRVFV